MTETQQYKQHLSDVFTRASAAYDQAGPHFFSHFGRGLVKFAGIAPGMRVLDVACGRGAVLFPALKSVGGRGEVVGVDISEGMIQEIRQDFTGRGITNARARRMDAERLYFPDGSFDSVLCGLGLFFLPDLERALAEFQRVLKPGGWLAASTFQHFEDELSRRWEALFGTFTDSLKPVPKAETKRLDSQDEIRQVLSGSGFSDIEIAADQETFYFRDEEEWWRAAWSHGGRAFLERLEPAALARYKQQAAELIRGEMTGQGIPETWHVFYARARKPA